MKFSFTSYLLKITILAVVYCGVARLGHLFSLDVGRGTLAWLPAGIALAALYLYGYRLWPGVVVGAFIATVWTGAPLASALVVAASSTLGALVGVYLLRRVNFDPGLAHVRDVTALVFLGAGFSSLLSTTLDIIGLSLTGLVPWPAYFSNWWVWWLGDVMGVLIIAPVLFTWTGSPNFIDSGSATQRLEAGLVMLTGMAVGLVVFGNWPAPNRLSQLFIYLPFPILLWAGLRFGPPGAAIMNLVVNVMAVLGTVRGFSPFATTGLDENLFSLWMFMGTASVTALVTAAVTAERGQAGAALRQAQKELRESQAQLAGIIASAMDAMVTINETQHIVLFNTAAEQMFGHSAADIIGQPHDRLLPEQLQAIHRQHVERFGQTGITNRQLGHLGPLTAVRADGQKFLVEASISQVEVAGQKLYTAILRDVTENVQIQEALRQSETRYRSVVEEMPGLLCRFQPGGIVEYTNETHARTFGLEPDALIGQSFLSLIPEEYRPAVTAELEALTPESPVITHEHPVIVAGDEVHWQRWTNRALFDAAGQIVTYQAFGLDITEYKQAEIERDTVFRRNQALVKALGEIVYDWQAKQNEADWAGDYERILGYSAEEIGHDTESWISRIHPDDLNRALQEIDAAGQENRPYSQEYRFRQRDGSYKWMHDQGILFYDTQGNLEQVIGIFRDISERKQAEEALQQSEARYRAIVEDQTELICRSTPDQIITFVNDAYGRFFGRTPEELIGQSFLQLVPIENHQTIRDSHAGLTPENPVVTNEHQEFRGDGNLRWLHWADRGIFDQTGQLVEIQAVGRDITEQRQAQQQIAFQKTLLECELEASPDGILIVSAEREWLYYNQRFVDMWGLPPEIVAARSSSATLPYIRSLLVEPEIVMAGIEHLLNHPTETNRVELRLKNGRIFDRYSAPVVSTANENFGRLWSFRDITRERELESRLLQSQKMEAIGQLAGGIAHDFNNILVPIIGYVELGMMSLSPDDKLFGDLQHVREAAERAANLTQQILAFSRKQMLQMKVIDLNGLVVEFQQLFRSLIGEDIGLQMFLEPNLYPIKADKGQIEQVLLNLVVNARDAMPTGGALTLETANVYLDETYLKQYPGPQTPGHYVMLAISDTGNGMDSGTQQLIFDPFFTTKERSKGTGLGLATVFGIIKQHNGHIWVYSEPGKGATFKIYLPQTEEDTRKPVAPNLKTDLIYGTGTILVVEDEEMVRKLVCETLVSHGYEVIEAPSPADGLRLAAEAKEAIHLLLTDVIMPDINGRELYQKVTTFQPEIKVLYMSGYTDNIILPHGVLDEGINFLQKPFTIHTLTSKVKQVLSYS
ncbi:MAG: PAS domain S-box protein [Anaerolineae bacterium]|nr:PAS domain S-box protein [Anaerolineae bacterium]